MVLCSADTSSIDIFGTIFIECLFFMSLFVFGGAVFGSHKFCQYFCHDFLSSGVFECLFVRSLFLFGGGALGKH